MAFFDQCDGRTNLTRRAIAALKTVVLDESRLHRMKLVTVRKTFDRRNLVALMRERETQAGIDAAPIHENRARTALTMIATFL